MNTKDTKKTANSDRTWRTQCINYLAWGRGKLTREQAINSATESCEADKLIIDETNKVVYYHAGICL